MARPLPRSAFVHTNSLALTPTLTKVSTITAFTHGQGQEGFDYSEIGHYKAISIIVVCLLGFVVSVSRLDTSSSSSFSQDSLMRCVSYKSLIRSMAINFCTSQNMSQLAINVILPIIQRDLGMIAFISTSQVLKDIQKQLFIFSLFAVSQIWMPRIANG